MKRIVTCLLISVWAAAAAQAPPAGDETAAAAEPALPCIPVDEDGQPIEGWEEEAQLGDEQDGGDGDEDGAQEGEPALEPCEEPEIVEEASPDEVFEPGDEISEDYPVPLPADI